MHVTRDLPHEVCVICELFVFGRENFVFLKFFPTVTDSKRSHGLTVQEIRNINKVTNGPKGTVASKTAKSVDLVEKGFNKLRLKLEEVNPTYKTESEVCLTFQVESKHAVSHFKHPSRTALEYARDLGNTMHESKRTSQWSAYYFTHRRSYYPVPENSIALRDIPKN